MDFPTRLEGDARGSKRILCNAGWKRSILFWQRSAKSPMRPYTLQPWARLLAALALLVGATGAHAAACANAATGTWTAAATWAAPCNVAGGPTAADDVTIINNTTVTVNAAGLAAGSLAIAGGANATTLTFNAGTSLNVTSAGGRTGNVVINGASGAVNKQITVLTAALNVDGSVTVTGGTSNNSTAQLTVTSGSITIGGSASLAGGGSASRDASLTVSTGIITINGGLTTTATFANSANVTISAAAGRIVVNGAAGVNNGGQVSVGAGTFSVTNAGAAFTNSNAAIAATTTLSTGTLTVAGNVSNAAGDTISFSAAGNLNVGGNWSNSGTFTRSTSTVTFNGAGAQTIGGAAVTTFNNLVVANTGAGSTTLLINALVAGNLSVNSGTLDLSTFTAGRTAAGGTITVASGASLLIGGTNGFPANYSTRTLGASSQVTYYGANQTFLAVAAPGYGYLTLSGSGVKTMSAAAALAIRADFTLAGTAAATALGALTVSGNFVLGSGTAFNAGAFAHVLAGNFTNNGATFTASTGGFTLNGAAPQTIGGTSSTSFNSLTINNGNGITLGASTTIGGTLTFTAGNISTGANTLIVAATGTVARTSGHVIGNLQKNAATGATSRTFEIGDANAYAPITIAFASVTTAGDLVARTDPGEHPDIGNSALDSTQDVNRYWTVTNSGVVFTTYAATLNYASGSPVDLDSGANVASFGIGKADACDGSLRNCTWSYPALSGAPTTTSAGATGMTGFSQFAVGKKIANFLVEAAGGGNIGTQTQAAPFNIRITARDSTGATVTGFSGTVQVTSGCTLSAGGGTSASFVNGVLVSYSVTISNAATCAITAARSGGTETGTSNSFAVVSAVTAFDGCEYTTPTRCAPGTANFNRLFTKLANQAFDLDLVALDGAGALSTVFSGSVTVDLLANAAAQGVGANNCPAAQTAVISLGAVSFSGGRPSAAIAVAANAFSGSAPNYSAYRDVRLRVSCNSTNCPPGGLTYCSADNFSVRPQDLTVSSNMIAGSLAAGANFTLSATAVAGYDGAPQLDRSASKVATHVGPADFTTRLRDAAGGNIISFPAAAIGTGAASATVQYHDAGSFRVLAGGVADTGFTAVDTAGTDCVAGSASNTASGGQYGCNIASQSDAGLFGRFFPSYYTMSGQSASAACAAGGFSYMGDPHIGLSFTLSAWSLGNPGPGDSVKLIRYTSGYAVLASVSVVAADGSTATDLSGNFSPSLAYNSANWNAGDYAVSGAAYAFARSAAAPSGPYDALYIAAGVSDADGALLSGTNYVLGNPACSAGCTHKLLSALPIGVRYGRLRMENAHGSPLLDLTIPVEAQYWAGSVWQRNTLDVCTSLPGASAASGNATGGLNAGSLSVGPWSNGAGSLTLAHPVDGSQGSVDITVNLGSAANANACPAWSPPAAASNQSHLRGAWCGGSFDRDPSAKATFGITRGKFIYRREVY